MAGLMEGKWGVASVAVRILRSSGNAPARATLSVAKHTAERADDLWQPHGRLRPASDLGNMVHHVLHPGAEHQQLSDRRRAKDAPTVRS